MVSLKELARADAERAPPAWLRPLLEATFFEACPEHPAAGGASRATRSAGAGNHFCTRCAGGALCSGCLAGHRGHRLIKVRKSSNHSVVKVAEVAALLDMSMVQTYLLNGDRVVFLKPRPVSGQGKPGASRCQECERGLQHKACRFCSIGCKLEGMEGDFEVSFAVPPRSESESEEEEPKSDDDSWRFGEEGVGTATEPPAAPAN